MIKKFYFIACALFVSAALSAATLVKNGKAASFVIIPEKAQPSVKVAAEELVYHIRKATGAKLPVYTENAVPASAKGDRIYLGACKKRISDPSKLPPAGFLIKAEKNTLYIVGNDRDTGPVGSSWHAVWHGTLWGVYEFLEKEMGVRWIWAGETGEVIPKCKNIVVKNKEMSAAPKQRGDMRA